MRRVRASVADAVPEKKEAGTLKALSRASGHHHIRMNLPINPPFLPMLARSVSGIPRRKGMYYEPKWDGFRCLLFRDGYEIELGSRNTRPLNRYFPELLAAASENLPEQCVLDGEIVVGRGDRLDFEALQLRIHPAVAVAGCAG
jgi:ATP-dependent DNA ligase